MPSTRQVVLKKCVIVPQPCWSCAGEPTKVAGHVSLIRISRLAGDRAQRMPRRLSDQSCGVAQSCKGAEEFERHADELRKHAFDLPPTLAEVSSDAFHADHAVASLDMPNDMINEIHLG